MLLSVFVAVNIACLPFAYLTAIYTKVRLLRKFWRTEREKGQVIGEIILFVSLGLVSLLLVLLRDVKQFCEHAFSQWKNQPLTAAPFIDIKTFYLLVEIFDSYGGVHCKRNVPLREVITKV